MTEADNLFGEDHVRRYRDTNGDVGHVWHGATVLLLTTKGEAPVSRAPHQSPMTALGTTNGGARAHPGWYRTSPTRRRSRCKWGARSSRRMLGPRRAPNVTACGLSVPDNTDWERFQARTEREVPVVVLERKRAAGHETTIRGGTQ